MFEQKTTHPMCMIHAHLTTAVQLNPISQKTIPPWIPLTWNDYYYISNHDSCLQNLGVLHYLMLRKIPLGTSQGRAEISTTESPTMTYHFDKEKAIINPEWPLLTA